MISLNGLVLPFDALFSLFSFTVNLFLLYIKADAFICFAFNADAVLSRHSTPIYYSYFLR